MATCEPCSASARLTSHARRRGAGEAPCLAARRGPPAVATQVTGGTLAPEARAKVVGGTKVGAEPPPQAELAQVPTPVVSFGAQESMPMSFDYGDGAEGPVYRAYPGGGGSPTSPTAPVYRALGAALQPPALSKQLAFYSSKDDLANLAGEASPARGGGASSTLAAVAISLSGGGQQYR